MNVASLELCKELYELSAWKPNTEQWQRIDDSDLFPAYDLGYLLRKLPVASQLHKLTSGGYSIVLQTGKTTSLSCRAETPENAACKLAIELFKQGILS